MHDPAVRAKMVAARKSGGSWRPVPRGGNGRPLPLPQRMLAEALAWETEVAVPTGKPRESGYPPSYKVDLGNRTLRIAVEVDGESHSGKRKLLDEKKDALLRGLGWTVLRFSNRQVTERLAECVRTVWSTTSRSRTPRPTS